MERHEKTIIEVIKAIREHFGAAWPCETKEQKRRPETVQARAATTIILSRLTDLKLRELAGVIGLAPGNMGNIKQRGREILHTNDALRKLAEDLSRRVGQ